MCIVLSETICTALCFNILSLFIKKKVRDALFL